MMKAVSLLRVLGICWLLIMTQTIGVTGAAATQDEFLDDLAQRTYTYLSSDWATSNHLPWSWRSATIEGGDYANTTEIALLMLSHLGAYQMNRAWSPSWQTVEAELLAILNQLSAWQSGSQASQPHGANAYQQSVFYQWYWISWSPPVVGAGDGNQLVPSIDNAFLAASLITLRAYGVAHGHDDLAQKADAILKKMDFRLWYNPNTHRFNWGAAGDPQGGFWADYYSNENRMINFVARALGQLTDDEYRASLEALVQRSATYTRGTDDPADDVTVQQVAWDGSYFTYTAPGVFIRELDIPYAEQTLIPATLGQIAYAEDRGYAAWGLSDCFEVGTGGYVQQGAPPTAMSGRAETRLGLVTPHASAMALMLPDPYRDLALANLMNLSQDFAVAYDEDYGFYDSLIADPNSPQAGQVSERFSALGQGWLFLSIVNAETRTIWDYFYQDEGVLAAHEALTRP